MDFEIDGFTFDNPNVILNPYDISPLTALILFKTDHEGSPKVTIVGKDDLTTYSHYFDLSEEHYIPIYGLYPNKKNKVIIECDGVKKEIIIKTDKLPKDFILPKEVKAKKSKLTNDLYFFTPASKGYTCAYDVNGDVRWYLTTKAVWDVKRLNNGNLIFSTERRVNPPYYMSGLYEMDMLGKIYKE